MNFSILIACFFHQYLIIGNSFEDYWDIREGASLNVEKLEKNMYLCALITIQVLRHHSQYDENEENADGHLIQTVSFFFLILIFKRAGRGMRSASASAKFQKTPHQPIQPTNNDQPNYTCTHMDEKKNISSDDEEKERLLNQVLDGEKCLRTTIVETIGTKAFRLLGDEFVQNLPGNSDEKIYEHDRNEFVYYILNYVRDGTRSFLITKENEDKQKEPSDTSKESTTADESTNLKNVWNQKRRITITRVSQDKEFPRNPLFCGISTVENSSSDKKMNLTITKKRSDSLSEATVSPRRVDGVSQRLTPRKVFLTPQKLNLLSTPKGKCDGEEEEDVGDEKTSSERTRRLQRLAYLYSSLLLTRRVPNILVELHLIVRLLTCDSIVSSSKSNSKTFSCKADCTYSSYGSSRIFSFAR